MEFKYKALTSTGKIVSGILNAENENRAIELIKKKKLDLINIKPYKKFLHLKKNVKKTELILFTKVFGQLIKSGVPIIKSLEIIKTTVKNKYFKEVITEIIRLITHGTSLSAALKKYHKIFDGFYCTAVEAGENSGQLSEVLEHIYNYLYNADELKKNIISALIYPAIIISISIFVLLGIILFLVPQFKLLFDQFYTDLPFITKSILYLNSFLEKNIFVLFLIFTGVIILFIFYFRTEKGKLIKDKLLLHIPFISVFVKENIYARISRIIGVLFANDVDIIKNLSIISDLISNRIFKIKLNTAAEEIKAGTKVSEAFQRTGIFSNILIQMTRIGEETGSFAEMFFTAAKYYEESLKMKSKILISIIQPVLIIITGIIIMFILIAIFMPIFQLSDLIK